MLHPSAHFYNTTRLYNDYESEPWYFLNRFTRSLMFLALTTQEPDGLTNVKHQRSNIMSQRENQTSR